MSQAKRKQKQLIARICFTFRCSGAAYELSDKDRVYLRDLIRNGLVHSAMDAREAIPTQRALEWHCANYDIVEVST